MNDPFPTEAADPDAGRAPARYLSIKRQIVARIDSGEWPVNHRLPSESDLVAALGVSRMTVNRALRELAMEGVIRRAQGVGSFVAERKGRTTPGTVRSIADEITERGHVHGSSVILLKEDRATPEMAHYLGLSIGDTVFHSIILHLENDVPVQLEDRHVNAKVAAGYLAQDFTRETPFHYLSRVAPLTDAEHVIEAVQPAPWEAKLLSISRTEPCLRMRRRTWHEDDVVTLVRLVYPGSRYRLEVPRARRARTDLAEL